MNYFGRKFVVNTFGESHGAGIGCVIDGVPSGLLISKQYIQEQLNRRKPGSNIYSTSRSESDEVEILSGVFEGFSTGTPIALFIKNQNQKSKDYDNVKDLFRPGHGDFTYFSKYGIRDHRGGGRSSARETAARVASGAIAKKMLEEFGVEVKSGVSGVGEIQAKELDFEFAKTSEIYALDKNCELAWKELIMQVRSEHDSIGASVNIKVSGLKAGLGEPLYYKLDAQIANALMGINAVKAVEIGEGVNASKLKGSQNNDQMDENGFLSNKSGGILAGISTGEDLVIKIHFKPTPSIFLPQLTQDIHKNTLTCNLRGRHDPCVGIRGSVVAEMMVNLLLADFMLLHVSSSMANLRKFYA